MPFHSKAEAVNLRPTQFLRTTAALGRQPGEELIDAPIDTARRNRSFAGVISAQGCNWTPLERKVAQVMADTGENRQIIERSNAKEAETVRASKRVVSEARSTAKASNAAFGATEKGSRRRVKGSGQRSSDPKASKTWAEQAPATSHETRRGSVHPKEPSFDLRVLDWLRAVVSWAKGKEAWLKGVRDFSAARIA
jgi:hypothetical protein